MIILKSFVLIILFWCTISIAEDGHCIWYGGCGPNPMDKITNCYYNGTAPRLTDEDALNTLKSICDMFYNGSDTYTCCAPDQIATLNDQFGMLKLLFGRCPSSYYNLRSLFCATTCHPQQSHFITVRDFGNSSMYPGRSTVESITNVMADDFAQRILDSSRNVLYPGLKQHSLDVICGRPYNECTKEDLMKYLGVENPAVPFPIYFKLTNNTFKNDYYNQSTFQCNQSVVTPYEHQPMCEHSDCPASPNPGPPPDVPGKYSNISVRTTQLIIVPNNQTFLTHFYLSPPGPYSELPAGPALEIGFLTQVLELQTNISQLEAYSPTNNRSIRLNDICLKPIESSNNNCVVFSVLQYFQNSKENLNKTIGDEFFLYADYLSHIGLCSSTLLPYNDTLLNISCVADFGGFIDPSMIFTNYLSTQLATNATGLVITIVIENSNDTEQIQSVEVWEKTFLDYMFNFTETQTLLRAQDRLDEMANFQVYYTNEHFLKNKLNSLIPSNNH